jgi:hypothetical protein
MKPRAQSARLTTVREIGQLVSAMKLEDKQHASNIA